MTSEPNVVATWDWGQGIQATNTALRLDRDKWVTDFFEKTPPAYIWRVEFIRWPSTQISEARYKIRVHRYSGEGGKRHHVWVKAADVHGHAQSVRLAHLEAPEEFTVSFPPNSDLLHGTGHYADPIPDLPATGERGAVTP